MHPVNLQSRRAALGALAGAVALASGTSPVFAEYGDGANVFGRITNKSGFVPYTGEGFALMLPSKWNPSKEKDFPDVKLRSANQKADTPVLDVANAALCAVCHQNLFDNLSICSCGAHTPTWADALCQDP